MKKYRDESWDYRKANTKYLTHCFHKYPAMMIPQVAGRLLDQYLELNPSCRAVLDPFCGSGTVLVEAKRRGLESWGIDINPLARLIAKTKTTPIPLEILEAANRRIIKELKEIFLDFEEFSKRVSVPRFFNIEYWFKPKVTEGLSVIKNVILQIENKNIQDFYKIAFSETVRECSNVRSGEFKLFRIPPKQLEKHCPDVLRIFLQKAERNFIGYCDFFKELSDKKYLNIPVHILDEDTRSKTSIPDKSIDLIITSPPYGDSRTTVAYGQFSRLSLQWLDFDDGICKSIDAKSLGGNSAKDGKAIQVSKTLRRIWNEIKQRDDKRASDIISFYNDMFLCLSELDRIMKERSRVCFVLGNRTVKNVTIPTDEILVEMFRHFGFNHRETIIRDIPNKTMPLKNSPTNVPGKVEKTMWNEFIVITERSI